MKSSMVTYAGCLLMLISAATLRAQGGARITTKEASSLTYTEVYNQLMSLEPDQMKVATVSGLMLQRDVATFMLDGGKLYLCKPVAGRVCAAVFVGEGTFVYTPPIDVERKQLGRFYQKESLMENFKVLSILFTDSTYEELSSSLKFASETVPPSVKDMVEDGLEYISEEKYEYFDESIMRSLLNREHNSLFYVQLSEKPSEPMFFRIDPNEEEEVQFGRRASGAGSMHAIDVVNQFHQQAYYASEDYHADPVDQVAIEHYTVDATIASNLGFSASTRFDFKPVRRGLSWLNFELSPRLRVDSMNWGDGSSANYYQIGTGGVWVQCSALPADTVTSLQMFYHGKIIDRKYDYFYLLDPWGWYPHHARTYKDNATFDLLFHTPTRYKFATIGEKISEQTEDETTISRWKMRMPTPYAAFNIGSYSEFDIKRDSFPTITVLMSRGGHHFAPAGSMEANGTDMDKQVGGDVESSYLLFRRLFGVPFTNTLFVTETPYAHGLAFPGLIHLWGRTFQRNDESGFDQLFRAHEVAHQWWAIGVDFQSYHDQWLSEAFAEYSGLLYMQGVTHDNDKFFKMLSDYRKEIIGNRKSIFGNGRQAGPIWLGYRTNSSSTQGDYDLIIYKKGAWVLHMLRNMMMDLSTMKEDKFFEVMSDFYNTYKGGEATTGDFEKTVEKHVGGMDMSWFFNEWVLGTDVPSYTFAYKVTDTLDGKYKITCRVKQENVGDDFKMYVPIKVDFGDNKAARLRVLIQGKGGEIPLPLMTMKPKNVIFNDLESVLCEVDTESW